MLKKLNDTKWNESDTGSYFSNHITVKYLGDEEPKYHVLLNPEDGGWVIGVFYTFIGEYVPLEEEGEKRLVFSCSEEAQHYVDFVLDSFQD